jgi:hypothetical protein
MFHIPFFTGFHSVISVLHSHLFHELFDHSSIASLHPIFASIEHDYDVIFTHIDLLADQKIFICLFQMIAGNFYLNTTFI